jgi:membrane protein implicated in regulation of membrane protease activity
MLLVAAAMLAMEFVGEGLRMLAMGRYVGIGFAATTRAVAPAFCAAVLMGLTLALAVLTRFGSRRPSPSTPLPALLDRRSVAALARLILRWRSDRVNCSSGGGAWPKSLRHAFPDGAAPPLAPRSRCSRPSRLGPSYRVRE